MPAPWVAPAIIAGATTLMNMIGRQRERKLNERYLARQNEYNTPQWQMMRYKQAGLNPALVYTQGSSGNQTTALSAPSSSPGTEFAQSYNQSGLAQSQVAANTARTEQTKVLKEVNELQRDLLARNPLLNDEGFKATIDSLKAAADVKQKEASLKQIEVWRNEAMANHQVSKIVKEVEMLDRKFKLNDLDQAIRAEVLKSKEFQNEILEIEKRFMVDFEMSPKNILDFLKILLIQLARK